MKIEDLIPVLAMIAYVAVMVFKKRRQSASGEKKAKAKTTIEDQDRETRLEKASQRSSDRSALEGSQKSTGFFSKLGDRLRTFLTELEQQFKMEAEKARRKKLESDNTQAMEQGLFKDFDSFEQFEEFEKSEKTEKSDREKKTSSLKASSKPEVLRRKKQAPLQRQANKKPETLYRSGVNLNLSPGEIRTAVVWSEILAPPLSLRAGKKSWEN